MKKNIALLITVVIVVVASAYVVFYFLPKPDLSNRGAPIICDTSPDFADYQQEVIPVTTVGTINFDSNQMAREMEEELLSSTESATVNFAGKYQLVEYVCGPYCQKHAIVDPSSGNIVYFGLDTTLGLSYQSNSRLLVLNPAEVQVPTGAPRNNPRYYEFKEGLLHLICEDN
jgi:hypothetical protein